MKKLIFSSICVTALMSNNVYGINFTYDDLNSQLESILKEIELKNSILKELEIAIDAKSNLYDSNIKKENELKLSIEQANWQINELNKKHKDLYNQLQEYDALIKLIEQRNDIQNKLECNQLPDSCTKEELEKQLQEINKKINSCDKKLDAYQQLNKEITATFDSIGVLEAKIRDYEKQQNYLPSSTEIKKELDELKVSLEKEKQTLNEKENKKKELEEELGKLEQNDSSNTNDDQEKPNDYEDDKETLEHYEQIQKKLEGITNSNKNEILQLAKAIAEGKNEKIQSAANNIATKVLEEQKSELTSDVLSGLNMQINNMNKRLGELRGLNGDAGVWLRAYSGRFSNDKEHFNYYATQVGADKIHSFANKDFIVGSLLGFDKSNAATKTTGYSIGTYTSFIANNGLFFDGVLKYIYTSYDKDGYDFKNQNSVLLSLEGGYRFDVNNSFYLEPSLELITGYISKFESNYKKLNISVDSYMPLILKPQLFAGYSVNDFTFRAGVGAILDANDKEAKLVIGDIIQGINANSSTKLDKNNRGFVSLGTAYKISDSARFNLSVERSFGSDLTNDYELNATIRYSF